MTNFMNVIIVATALIAVVALIIGIMAYSHTTSQTTTFDGKVTGPSGEQMNYQTAFSTYLGTDAGKDFMSTFLTQGINNQRIKDVLNNGMVKNTKYQMISDHSKGKPIGFSSAGMGDSRTTLQIPMDKSDISFLDFDAKIS